MRTLIYAMLAVVVTAPGVLAQTEQDTASDSQQLRFGVGLHFTATEGNVFPTGASARLWILEQYGLEVDVFTRESNPTFTIRTFYRLYSAPPVQIFVGGGVAFFSSGLSFDSTFQGVVGLEIDIGPQLVFSAEVGGLIGTTASVPVSAGVGVHYYF